MTKKGRKEAPGQPTGMCEERAVRDGQVSQSVSCWLVGSPLADVAALARRSFSHPSFRAFCPLVLFRCDGLSCATRISLPLTILVWRWEDAVCHLGRFIP